MQKRTGQALQGDFLEHVWSIAALQEGGVDRHEGLEAGLGHAGAHIHGVLFGDAHIPGPLGKAA